MLANHDTSTPKTCLRSAQAASRPPPTPSPATPDSQGTLVPVDGGKPDGAQGDLGLPAQAAARRRPHHQGGRGHGAERGIPALLHTLRHHRHLDDEDSEAAGESGGWHALVYTKTAEYAFERDDFLLLAQSEEEAPEIHRRFLDKRSPLAPAPLLDRLAVGPGPGDRRDSAAPVLRRRRLPLQPRWEAAQGGPLRCRGVGKAGAAGGEGRGRWIER